MRRTLMALAVTLAFCGGLAGSASANQSFESVVGQFMCVSCHEPLNQVNAPQAVSEKQTLRGLIARGLSLGQIKTAMVSQYGPEVLGRPPASGFDLTVYILPPAVFVGGLALLALTLPRWRQRSRRATSAGLRAAAPLSSDDAKRLDDELTNFI